MAALIAVPACGGDDDASAPLQEEPRVPVDGNLRTPPTFEHEGPPPGMADHWHAAYGVFVCDEFLPALEDLGPDTTGIHTHDDGIVHVHPFAPTSAGERASWGRFGDAVGLSFDGASFTLDGVTYGEGHDCDGRPASVSLHEWPADDPSAAATVHTGDLWAAWFHEDRLAFTLAVVPDGTEVPRPPTVPRLDDLSDVVPP